MTDTKICSKCGGIQEKGFTPDFSYGAVYRTYWIPGKAVKSFWTGLTIRGKPKYPIVLYRCTNCGFLEAYANKEQSD